MRKIKDLTEPKTHLCSFGPEAAAGGMLLGEGIVGAEIASGGALAASGGAFAGAGAAVKAAMPYVSAAGTALQVVQGVQAGKFAKAQGQAAQSAADYEAKQLEAKANQERAVAQRRLLDERRRTAYAQSRLQAVAGASGAGGEGIEDLAGDIETEGEYRALSALYEGEERARGLETGAGVRRTEGSNAAAAGRTRRTGYYLGAGGSLLSGGASLFEKYGMGGPRPRYA